MLFDKNRVLEAIVEGNSWDKRIETGIERPRYLEQLNKVVLNGQVAVVTGVRRAGKSYILRQYAQKLEKQGIDARDIVYVNFEDIRLGIETAEEWEKVYQMINEYLGRPLGQKWLLLDEIQEVAGWEKWVRTMTELRKAKIVVSGSNSQLLSWDLGEKLTGRHLDVVVYPLSFTEFVKFNQGMEPKWYLKSYLQRGGFPMPVLQPQVAEELLLTYFSDVVGKDIVKRYKVRNRSKLLEVARFVMSNFAALHSFTNIGKFLELAPDTVRQYLKYLADVYLAFGVRVWSAKPKEVEKSPRKIYAVDTGLANIIGGKYEQNLGRLAENAVYLELLRRGVKTSYWKDELHREIDFVARQGEDLQAIQVCWEIGNLKTKDREVKSLIRGMDNLGLREGFILNEEVEKNEVVSGKVIKYRKLSDWLLA